MPEQSTDPPLPPDVRIWLDDLPDLGIYTLLDEVEKRRRALGVDPVWMTRLDGKVICRSCTRESMRGKMDYNEHRRFLDWYLPVSFIFVVIGTIWLFGLVFH